MKKREIVLLVIVFISCNESKSEGVWNWQGAPCDPDFGIPRGHCNSYVGGHHCSCDCNPSYFNDYCLDEETQVYCNNLGYIRFQVCDELWCGERAFCGLGEDGEDCYCP